MPYKSRNNRRHKFAKTSYKITNWPEYNNVLQERGSVRGTVAKIVYMGTFKYNLRFGLSSDEEETQKQRATL